MPLRVGEFRELPIRAKTESIERAFLSWRPNYRDSKAVGGLILDFEKGAAQLNIYPHVAGR
jgi:hypothetical protein